MKNIAYYYKCYILYKYFHIACYVDMYVDKIVTNYLRVKVTIYFLCSKKKISSF